MTGVYVDNDCFSSMTTIPDRISRRTRILVTAAIVTLLITVAWHSEGSAGGITYVFHGVNTPSGNQWHDDGDSGLDLTSPDANRTMNFSEYLRMAYSPAQGLVNPHNFKLLLDEPSACLDSDSGTPKRVFLLVLVISTYWNYERRRVIRETWGSPKELNGRSIVTLFLLGSDGIPMSSDRNVVRESAQHRDLLMEDFQESYKNLTLKTIMAMKWASTHCQHASYVMKTDDDMYVSYQNLLNYIADSKAPKTNLAFGLVLAGQAPIRDKRNKWYMPRDLFAGDVYPPWLSGGGFVLSGDVPGQIYAESLRTRHLHLEDVYVGVCLERLKIPPLMNDQFNNMHVDYSYCKFRSVITSHHVSPIELRNIWHDQLQQKSCWFWT